MGSGTYSTVHRGVHLESQRPVAIKKVRTVVGEEGINFTVLREIRALRAVSHENVLELLDVYRVDQQLFIVLEGMDRDLRAIIADGSIDLAERHVKCIILQVLRGVAALHAVWTLHRDVAPANILVASNGVVKISDLGMSREIEFPPVPMTVSVVTMWYRAPEP